MHYVLLDLVNHDFEFGGKLGAGGAEQSRIHGTLQPTVFELVLFTEEFPMHWMRLAIDPGSEAHRLRMA
jgi:hypothetical protein